MLVESFVACTRPQTAENDGPDAGTSRPPIPPESATRKRSADASCILRARLLQSGLSIPAAVASPPRNPVHHSANRGKQSVNRRALDELKQQIPLLEYLQAHDWQQARPIGFGRFLGLCPLHADHKPSFLVDPSKNLFHCYGCRRGGDIIRFVELYHQVKFPEAVALLQQWRGLPPLLHDATSFYRMQLHRHAEAVAYLYQRGIRSPEVIEHMRIGYAPGGCLRGWLTQMGYSLQVLRQAGLVTASGYDSYRHRVVFPLEGNFYGRSLSAVAPPHRFLPGAKGGLYSWDQVRLYPEVILVEGCST